VVKVDRLIAHDMVLTCFTCGRSKKNVFELDGEGLDGPTGSGLPSFWMCMECLAKMVNNGKMTLSHGESNTTSESLAEPDSEAFEVSW
jgi:hypothetical protein